MWIVVILSVMLAVICVGLLIRNIKLQRDLEELKGSVCVKDSMIEELEKLYIMKNPDRVGLKDFLSEKLKETGQMRADISDNQKHYEIAGKYKTYTELLEKVESYIS